MRIALAQLDIEGGAVEDNCERAEAAIAEAADEGADLVSLPEIFNVGYFSFDTYRRAAEPVEGPTLTRIADTAREHDIGVLAGSIVEDLARTESVETPADEGLANTSVFFDRDGERLAVYRKHHLFGYESAEAQMLVAGESLGIAEFEGATVGMTTCYDLRFPELYRSIAAEGADLVLVPSAWPYPRVEHWKLLPRARAVENQFFVATVNGSGDFEDASLLGRSTVYDPWGTTLAGTGDDPDLVVTDVDLDRVETVREEFPAWHDRRT
ncbi:nitrilase-related carbon-nitrogen hydrolase [Halorussus sp. MSC15.2]|uniref:nitrilase-related carbon-nitrogen hydrolase n=1 Tax=Halorussus sp. MSC15.2 TaxID=2283638 RepID=UPI0013D7AABB|nr:nitrilase-related carbon-nitrogen hydrolase [Halorussus sp. MSC15.2]NEU57298.1 carbon-nitrogen family hydrolase [Halorussus sp. MSC15.2]